MRFAPSLPAFIGLGCILAAGPAFAHAHLKDATPADQATVAVPPTSLSLDFTEGLNLAFSGVDIVDSSGEPVNHAGPILADHDATLTVPLQSALHPGAYTVKWHVLSTDGHKTEGSYSFVVKP